MRKKAFTFMIIDETVDKSFNVSLFGSCKNHEMNVGTLLGDAL
jgi:hypothetical protein